MTLRKFLMQKLLDGNHEAVRVSKVRDLLLKLTDFIFHFFPLTIPW